MQSGQVVSLPGGQAHPVFAGSLVFSRRMVAMSGSGASERSFSGMAPLDAHDVPCKVLVVDDDPSILYLVAQALEMAGHRVTTATNGREALEALDHAQPQVALLDMRMPVLDGWGFAQAVKEQGIQMKIVIMTATTDARRWADEIGADGFLGKPFALENLLGIIQRMCQS